MKVRISMRHHPNFVKVENTSPVMYHTRVYLQYWSLPSCNENSGEFAILRHACKIAVQYNLSNCLATVTHMTQLESSQKDLQNEYQKRYILCYRWHLLSGKTATLITVSKFYFVETNLDTPYFYIYICQ